MGVRRGTGMTREDQVTVLIVEDEEELADTYARWLSDECRVYTAYNGSDAIDTVDESIDVVLLDRRLPDIPGREVLDAIRDRGLDCRVALITAVDPDFDIVDMEFEDYIVKPVLKSELQSIVDRLYRLSTFDKRSQDSFALASKLEVLHDEKTHLELRASDEYKSLKDDLEDLQDGIDDILREFEHRDFTTLYEELADREELEN